TIMRVVKALDAGPMMATERRPIDPDETSEVVEADLARRGGALLVDVVNRLSEGRAEEQPQIDADATYAHRLTKDDGVIDWHRPAVPLHNQIRGLHPWPHAFSYLHGQRLILLTSAVVRAEGAPEPGTVIEADGDRLRIATGDDILGLLRVQPEGKRPLTTREFL